MNRRGITALEVLIASVIFAIAVVAMARLFTSIDSQNKKVLTRTVASSQLTRLMDEIKNEWRFRLKDTDPVTQPFVAIGNPACRGLRINQRTRAGGIRVVEFDTVCQANPIPAVNPGPHTWTPNIGCIPQVVQRANGVVMRTYPINAQEGYGTVNCFSVVNPVPARAEIRVRAVGLFLNGTQTNSEGAETVLTGTDRNAGIELLR